MDIDTLRSLRVADIALFDLIGSIVGMRVLAKAVAPQYTTHFMVAAVPLGVVVHYALGVNTTLNHMLRLSDKPARRGET